MPFKQYVTVTLKYAYRTWQNLFNVCSKLKYRLVCLPQIILNLKALPF